MACSLDLCSAASFPHTRMSSTWQRMPGRPESTSFIYLWKISGALDIPNGTLLKQKHPKGVMNVVSRLDSSARGICQNPLFASSLLKTFAPDSCAKVISTFGIGWTSRKTFLLSGLRSIQIRTVLSPLEPQPLWHTRVCTVELLNWPAHHNQLLNKNNCRLIG